MKANLNKMNNNNMNIKFKKNANLSLHIFVLILGVIMLLGIIVIDIGGLMNQNTYTVTVTDKNIKRSDGKDIYLIYTTIDSEDGRIETFENTDSFWYGKWDSSNMYAKLQIGRQYRIKVYGYRIPFLTMYQNIIECNQLN